MKEDWRRLSRAVNLGRALDENNCPVARMRLFSRGVQTNNRIYHYETVTGDKGCLACGNCIDACPVVRERRRFVFVQNQRTSMSLENIVGDECRRCYACVRACPQVTKSVKEVAAGFRRAERFVHHYTATLIFLLAATGIFAFHYGEHLPLWQNQGMTLIHAFAGFCLLAAPVLYWLLDRRHFRRALACSFRFGAADRAWLRDFFAFLRSPRRRPLPSWQEFNTYHKFWFAYLATVVPLLGLTGVVNLFDPEVLGAGASGAAYWVHVALAMLTDALVIAHLYFKVLRWIFRNLADMAESFRREGTLHYPFLYHPRTTRGGEK